MVAAVACGLAMASPAPAQSPYGGRPIYVPMQRPQTVNPNPYIAPGLTLQQYAYNTATIGRALSKVPPYAFGYNPYPTTVNYGPVYPTYAYPYTNPYLATSAFPYSSYPSASPYLQ
jgi:hypothetical protein